MAIFSKRPASALLTTILLMAAFSGVSILASSAFISSSRTTSTANNTHLATQIAQQGLEEGLLRITQGTPAGQNLLKGEYGEGSYVNAAFGQLSTYSLQPMRRGYSSNCTTILADASISSPPTGLDLECPYYDMAVRNTVNLKAAVSQGNTTVPVTYTYPSSVLIAANTTFQIKRGTQLVAQASNGAYQLKANCKNSDGTSSVDLAVQTVSNGQKATFNCPNSLFLTSLTVQSVSGSAPSLTVSPVLNGYPLAIEKGFTTVDSTGHVGGVVKRLLEIVTRNSGGSLVFNKQEIAVSYDANGCLIQTGNTSVCSP